MQLGDFELTPLLDRHFRLDGGAMFGVVPKPLWEKRAPPDDRNRISMGMRPLLVRARSTLREPQGRPEQGRGATGSGREQPLMIIDAGAGEKMDAKLQDIYSFDRTEKLDDSLARAGVRAEDVEIVLASHLHFDHAGGFTKKDASGAVVPRFPNARYLVSRGEWEDATHPHERNRASYFAENYVPLADAGMVDFIAGDREIVPGVRVRRTDGHTRYHQIVYIESGGQTAVFTADLIPTTAHVDVPWIMAYDLYPMKTLEFKRAFVREAIDGEYLIFFEHDPTVAAGYIREKNGRPYVEPAG
ncbi:MAG TPA: MBL fold metallo-hydrolase [Vicinamibacterales bacterium]|nr:MBL fold metallo-hydrolase [Vicinamibacterales bacterium]